MVIELKTELMVKEGGYFTVAGRTKIIQILLWKWELPDMEQLLLRSA